MPNVTQSLIVPFTRQQMYALVNDVASYPEFLPWCKTATVHEQTANNLHATICIGKGPIMQSITTMNTMIPSQQIKMVYQAGSFKSCAGAWDFLELPDHAQCQVHFKMDYEFASRLHALTIEPIFGPLANTLISAFYQRARTLYAK